MTRQLLLLDLSLLMSGDVVGGAVFAAPAVVDGRMLVAAWDDRTDGALIAFQP